MAWFNYLPTKVIFLAKFLHVYSAETDAKNDTKTDTETDIFRLLTESPTFYIKWKSLVRKNLLLVGSAYILKNLHNAKLH